MSTGTKILSDCRGLLSCDVSAKNKALPTYFVKLTFCADKPPHRFINDLKK